jgi:hypothetical protein
MQEIRPADDADKLAILHNRQPLDAMTLHQTHDLLERRLGRDGLGLGSHDLGDLLPGCLNVFGSKLARPKQEFQPARPLPLSPELAAAQEIAFGHHPHELALVVDYWQSADLVLQHQPHSACDRCVGLDRNRAPCHDIVRFHGLPPCIANVLLQALRHSGG